MSSATLKCPTCNCSHHAKTDVFGNEQTAGDFDAREVFGVSATCPICQDDCSDIVALPCGHVLCKECYCAMGGCVKEMSAGNDSGDADETENSVLVHIRKAGMKGVNGTYRRHHNAKNKYTSMGRYNGEDAEFQIAIRQIDGQKYWFLCCDGGNPSEPPVDFYKAKVNASCPYPSKVEWESATLFGTFPCPRASVSFFQ